MWVFLVEKNRAIKFNYLFLCWLLWDSILNCVTSVLIFIRAIHLNTPIAPLQIYFINSTTNARPMERVIFFRIKRKIIISSIEFFVLQHFLRLRLKVFYFCFKVNGHPFKHWLEMLLINFLKWKKVMRRFYVDFFLYLILAKIFEK